MDIYFFSCQEIQKYLIRREISKYGRRWFSADAAVTQPFLTIFNSYLLFLKKILIFTGGRGAKLHIILYTYSMYIVHTPLLC